MAAPTPEPWNRDLEQVVRAALAAIRFGTVTLVVQDGRVIQVDKSEKTRINEVGHIGGSGS